MSSFAALESIISFVLIWAKEKADQIDRHFLNLIDYIVSKFDQQF